MATQIPPGTSAATGAALGAASGAAAWLSLAKDWVLELFGVPLPVFLGGATGAFFARSFLPPAGFLRALAAWVAWTMIGSFLAELARGLAEWALGAKLPVGAGVGLSLLLAGGGTLFFTAALVEKIRHALGRRIDNIGRPRGGGGGGGDAA